MPTCQRCKRLFTYNDTVGYSKKHCGPMCDGNDEGRRAVIRAMLSLAEQLRAKAAENEGSKAELAFEASASSIEQVCGELAE